MFLKGDALLGTTEAEQPQLVKALLVHTGVHPADAIQGVVMENHDLPVPGKLHVQLHAIADLGCQPESLQGVLRHALVLTVQAAVSKASAVEGSLLPLGDAAGGQQKQGQTDCRRTSAADQGGLF